VRRRFVNLILAGFIAGSVYDIVTDQEHWPFSQYPMFSGTWTSPTFTWLRLASGDHDLGAGALACRKRRKAVRCFGLRHANRAGVLIDFDCSSLRT